MNNLSQQKFLTMFNDMLNSRQGKQNLTQVLRQQESGDEVDKLVGQREKNLSARLDQRNILFLKKVEQAKQKILEGTYGTCEECEGEISQKRLQARPTASLCIKCQEDKEREEFCNFKKRRDLSKGEFKEEGDFDHIVKKPKFTKVEDIAFESVVDL